MIEQQRQTMATRLRRQQNDIDEEAAAPYIASDVLRSLVMAVAKSMTPAIANATVLVASTPKTISYSSAIYPYDGKSFEMKMKEGKYWWHLITKTAEGWKKDGISAIVEHANKILDLFKDHSVQFGLDNIMNIPTSRTGEFHATPQTFIGMDHWNMDVMGYINILTSYHQLYLYQVRALSGWIMGNETSSLTKFSDMNINAINPNEARNFGLWIKYNEQRF